MRVEDLNGGWRLRSEDLSLGGECQAAVADRKEGWFEAALPTDVRVPLIAAGLLAEPLEKLNCFDSEWIEEKSWWFVREFDAVGSAAAAAVDLVLDYLDYGASIYLNGNPLGEHDSVFYPFRAEVKRFMVERGNRLVVRLSAGADRISSRDQGDFRYAVTHESANGRPDRGERKRVFLRKPQYAFGWDWGPRAATVGIGAARLEYHGTLEIDSLSARLEGPIARGAAEARIRISVELDNRNPLATREAILDIAIYDPARRAVDGAAVSLPVFLRAGINLAETVLVLRSPELWWPNGAGPQPLYEVRAQLRSAAPVAAGTEWQAAPVEAFARFAVRSIELDQSSLPDLGAGYRAFSFRVNGEDIFCKGANWIPADSLYHRVTDAKYRSLVDEAAEANFNMLRVWGGGLYERESFYEACDERGILVWQDFMFGCGFYPDRDPRFLDLVEKELAYQIPRLRAHPCLALFCGNNENHWAMDTAWFRGREPYFGGEEIWNRLAPRMVARLAPEIPYWNSSPYGGEHPNDPSAGDRHHWREAMMHPEMAKRIEPHAFDWAPDNDLGRFISEYGYVGPCARPTVEAYFAGEKVEVGSPIWQHHNNAFEKDTVAAGIAKHYRDPVGLALDDYLLYAGLVQGLMYGYSLESLRASPRTYGALFWMYADCWGETGWTIVDYYLRRKVAFQAVRRAFAPVALCLRLREGRLVCWGVNETASPLVFDAEWGVIALDGSDTRAETRRIELPAFSRKIAFAADPPDRDPTRELVFVKPVADASAENASAKDASGSRLPLPAVLRERDFPALQIVEPGLSVADIRTEGNGASFTVRAAAWAHAVHFRLPGGTLASDRHRLSDEWFDLLPGEERRIRIEGLDASGAAGLKTSSLR